MQCQLCNKHATVHLTEIVNGQKTEKHLCEECAITEGVTVKANVPINDLLSNLMAAQKESQQIEDMTCPEGDITWRQFRKEGLLGCPHDYAAFEEPLRKLIERTQEGESTHVGRAPKHTGGRHFQRLTLLRLRQELQEAIDQEDYEAAVRLRDEIDKCESN